MSARASFELTALLVTWIGVALLVVLVANLHARLRRLEQAGADARPAPYGHLLGRRLQDLVETTPLPRVLFFLSSNCSSCARLLGEIASPSWTVPSAIVWTGGAPPPAERTPVLADRPQLGAELGIRVTPFALVADADGRVVKAGPVGSLHDVLERSTST